jgi:ribosomal protein L37AE/L43A
MQPNFEGATSVAAQPGAKKYCPRCGHAGVQVTSPDFKIWNCAGHGEIYRKELVKPASQAAAPESGWTPDAPKAQTGSQGKVSKSAWTPDPPKA